MADPNFIIETPHLHLTHFLPTSQAHCAFLVQLYNSPRFIAAEGKTGITTEGAAQERIQRRFVAEYERNGYGTYLVSLKPTGSSPAQPIGTVSLNKGDSLDALPVPDVGFAIVPEMNGKGYATEAANALLVWAAQVLGVTEVLGLCNPDNKASRRILEKLGFEYRGVRKLKPFGGFEGAVYAKPEMKDLEEYGFD